MGSGWQRDIFKEKIDYYSIHMSEDQTVINWTKPWNAQTFVT